MVTLSAGQIARPKQVSEIAAAFPCTVLEGARSGYAGSKVEEFTAPAIPSRNPTGDVPDMAF